MQTKGNTMSNLSKPPSKRKLSVGFVLARSFTLSAFGLFADAIRLASDDLDRSGRVAADWQVIGSSRFLVASSCGVQVSPTCGFVDPGGFDYIVVVGGLLKIADPLEADALRYLKEAAAKGVVLIGLCTGSFILADAGLMEEHETCVSWLHHVEFRERFPKLKVRSDRLYNLDSRRGSCAGGSSAIDLAALIVRRHLGKEAERNALEVLQVERARSALDVQPRRPLPIEVDDPRLKSALINMENSVGSRLPVARIAASVGLSRRQLERLFAQKLNMTLGGAYKQIALEKARARVDGSNLPIVEIAIEFGYQSASTFSKNFKRRFGESPAAFRARRTDAGANGRQDAARCPF